MNPIHSDSLASTLDAANAAFFAGQSLPHRQRRQVACWIARRHGLAGAYANMFAPTARDFRQGLQVFTGERIQTRAGVAHILGEEACRALILLDVADNEIRRAQAAATAGLRQRLALSRARGTYCCGICTVAYWRHLAVGGLDHARSRLAAGMRVLRKHRLGDGRWRRFPFWFTLLALSEIDAPGAAAERRYAAPVLERYLRRPAAAGKFAKRRWLVAERILDR